MGLTADMLPGRDPRARPSRVAQTAAILNNIRRDVKAEATPHMIVRVLSGDFRGRDRCVNHVWVSPSGAL
jgi:hypothetical protein